jgi:hypothetical protein
MIVSVLDKVAGFYSILFFTINHYMACKKKNESFKLDSSEWLFKSVNGWTDYFKSIDFTVDNDTKEPQHMGQGAESLQLLTSRCAMVASLPVGTEGSNLEHRRCSECSEEKFGHNSLLDNFNMHEYKRTIHNDFYLYNDTVQKEIDDTKERLGLVSGEYDTIFIRRGDKLFCESQYYDTEKYVVLLLQKHPECTTIFLQTDDYNCFLDIEKYIRDHDLNIKVITLCDPTSTGIVVFERDFKVDVHNCKIGGNQSNIQYVEKIADNLHRTKPVSKMNAEEIYRHTVDMLVGVDICLYSNYCILDNQSNVARFISIAHNDHTKLFDVRYPNENIVMGWTMCPAYW